MNRRDILVGAGAVGVIGALPGCATVSGSPTTETTVWTFDRLTDIGGHATTVEGEPVLIDTPLGKAVKFDGVDDALFIDNHPLAGAEMFTFEAVFRPDGGAFEQRWFHLQEAEEISAAQGQPPGTRFLFEIRVEKDEWWLDAFIKGPGYNQVLIYPEKRHPIGQWFHVAQTYDGTTYRSYVDGVLQGEAAVAFKPQGAGRASVGCRINRVNFFNGAVREARFTPEALTPERFTRLI
ncbi:MAG: LamG-like jellyroll fold domain-containing protein [Brevundimonas sp.]